jgi:hypothetical protein
MLDEKEKHRLRLERERKKKLKRKDWRDEHKIVDPEPERDIPNSVYKE